MLLAKLWGALNGLTIAWNMGFRKVWLKMDSIESLKLIKHGCMPTHPNNSLIEVITDVPSRSWHVRFSHTHKDNNKI